MYIFVCLFLYLFYDADAIPAIEANPLNDVSQEEKDQTDADALLKEIKVLERQKNDLYKEINKAIDESIAALTKSNDTDAVIGVKYIQDLKKQMKEYNDTEDTADVNFFLDPSNDTFINGTGNGITIALRRKMKVGRQKNSNILQGKKPAFLDENEKYLQDAQKELDRLLNKGMTGEKLKERLERREKIRVQLEEWIKTKDREREKIKQYRDQQKRSVILQELCPRTGYSGQKKKSKKGEHGCCRKCCKRSYLGCLKK